MPTLRKSVAWLLLLLLCGCASTKSEDIPPRQPWASGGVAPAGLRATPSLFQAITSSSNRAMVGIKEPGLRRGVWKGSILISKESLDDKIALINTIRGVHVVERDEILPFVMVELSDEEALTQLRSQPYVDYVEPAASNLKLMDISGCGPTNTPSWPMKKNELGDVLPRDFATNGIEGAWKRGVTGRGITVGIVDTGVAQHQTQLLPEQFSTGESAGRTITYEGCTTIECTDGLPLSAFDSCSHGTRVAGLIGSPKNGFGAVGVAFGSNLIVAKGGDGVVSTVFDVHEHVRAIRKVRWGGAKIIEMAFGAVGDGVIPPLEDTISFEYHRTDMSEVIFIGAAGSIACSGSVVFPASMPEVVAVTGINEDGTLEKYSCTGPQVRMAVVLEDVETDAPVSSFIATLGASSGASAMASGIAALVWSRYPQLTRNEVINRMMIRGGRTQIGDGVTRLNAQQATGGILGGVITSSKDSVRPNENYTVTTSVDGDGPFSFLWNTGETSSSIVRQGPGDVGVVVTDKIDGTSLNLKRTIPAFHNPQCTAGCDESFKQCMQSAESIPMRNKCRQERSECIAGC